MKKILYIFLLLFSSNIFALNLDVTGEIKDMTCDVKTNYKNLIVVLPTVGSNLLVKKGDTAGLTKFSIHISNCINVNKDYHIGKKLYALFQSDHIDTTNNNTLRNTATIENATKVNIQLTNNEGTAIKIFDGSTKLSDTELDKYSSTPIKNFMKATEYVLTYGAQYYATGKATAGYVESFATFTITYR